MALSLAVKTQHLTSSCARLQPKYWPVPMMKWPNFREPREVVPWTPLVPQTTFWMQENSQVVCSRWDQLAKILPLQLSSNSLEMRICNTVYSRQRQLLRLDFVQSLSTKWIAHVLQSSMLVRNTRPSTWLLCLRANKRAMHIAFIRLPFSLNQTGMLSLSWRRWLQPMTRYSDLIWLLSTPQESSKTKWQRCSNIPT